MSDLEAGGETSPAAETSAAETPAAGEPVAAETPAAEAPAAEATAGAEESAGVGESAAAPPPEVVAAETEAASRAAAYSEAVASAASGGGGGAGNGKKSPGKAGRIFKSVLSIVLCVLGVILLVLSPLAIWGRNILLNTDRYVSTVSPLASSPAVQEAVVNVVVTQVDDNINTTDLLAPYLPANAVKVLAGPTQSALDQLVRTITTKFVQSKAFYTLWVQTNRLAHEQIVHLLTGKPLANGDVTIKGGQVVLDLSQVVRNVKERLVSAGITIASQIPPIGATLKIAQLKGLGKAQSFAKLLNTVADWLPFVGLALCAVGVYVARRRRRAAIACLLGLAGGMLIIGLGLLIGRSIYLNNVNPAVLPRSTAEEIFNTIVRYLRDGIRLVAILALVVAAAVWASGPSKAAVGVRRAVGNTADRFGGKHVHAGPVSGFVARYTVVLRIAVVALAGLILVLMTQPSGLAVIILAILVVVGLVAIEVIRAPVRQTAVEEPSQAS